MPVDAALRAFVAIVGGFYITEKRAKHAQRQMETALQNGQPDAGTVRQYFETMDRYFSGFEAEARGHLRAVDRRLENVNQMHFNLAAERAVAVKRIELTQNVLGQLKGLASSERLLK
ncbi:MAG: hypothetical protein DLM50_06415 [Candidatus Meridianibacter frigidus]|nr:MAG: hypothetical protein DLM50_06415 [Candidatus Eremiobacteraeota bacterium]